MYTVDILTVFGWETVATYPDTRIDREKACRYASDLWQENRHTLVCVTRVTKWAAQSESTT